MDTFVTIYDWMLELGLTGMEMNAYAVIYSFGKDGDWYKGSASYIGKWMGTKRKATVLSALSSLVEKGLVEKRDRWQGGKHMCDYRPVRRQVRKAYRTGTPGVPHIYSDIDKNNKEIKNKENIHLTVDEFIKRHRQ